MKFNIITIFPEIFDSYFSESIIKRAQEKGVVEIKSYDLRAFTLDKHKKVDDTPYGGGAGMVMNVEPIFYALKSLETKNSPHPDPCLPCNRQALPIMGEGEKKFKVVLLSAKGRRWNQELAKEYSKLDEVIFVCGRYEGVDERVLEFIDEEISIGDYVLTGGELGAMVIIDSITRLLPGALGNDASSEDESHSTPGLLEYPQYTRPEVFEANGKKYAVPEILLSGDHKKIEEWRRSQMKKTIK